MPDPTDADSAETLLRKRRYSCATTFLTLVRRFHLSPSEGGPRSGFLLGKLADIFGLQLRGKYRGQANTTRMLSKVATPLDGLSEALALFLTFPWSTICLPVVFVVVVSVCHFCNPNSPQQGPLTPNPPIPHPNTQHSPLPARSNLDSY